MKHIHHKIPRHAGGTNEPENLVELTVEEHAEAHRLLYEKHGREEDRIAWLGLSAQIGKEEMVSLLASLGGQLGKEKLYDWHKKISGSSYEEIYGEEKAAKLKADRSARFSGDKNPQFGIPRTEEWRKNHSEGMSKEKHFNYGKPAFNRGRIRITNGVVNKMIPLEQFSAYEAEGWRKGVTPLKMSFPSRGMKGKRHSEETKQKMRERALRRAKIKRANQTDLS